MSIAPGYIEKNWNTLISSAVVLLLGVHYEATNIDCYKASGLLFTFHRTHYAKYLEVTYPEFREFKDLAVRSEFNINDIIEEFIMAHEIYDEKNYHNDINIVSFLAAYFSFCVRHDQEMYDELYDGTYADELFGFINTRDHIEYKQLLNVVCALLAYNYKGFYNVVEEKFNKNVEQFDDNWRRALAAQAEAAEAQAAGAQATGTIPQNPVQRTEDTPISRCYNTLKKFHDRMDSIGDDYQSDSNVRYLKQRSVVNEYLGSFNYLMQNDPNFRYDGSYMVYYVDYFAVFAPEYVYKDTGIISADEFLENLKRFWQAVSKCHELKDKEEKFSRDMLSNSVSNSLQEFAEVLSNGGNTPISECNWNIIHARLEYLIGECFPEVGIKIARENASK